MTPDTTADPGQNEGRFEELAALLRSIVARKAGLEADMLDLDMDMSEDLALDSITRIEIVAAMRDAVPLRPNVTEEELLTIRTLRDVLRYF